MIAVSVAPFRPGERKHAVMDVVRNLTPSRISATTAVNLNLSMHVWKEVAYGSKGDLSGSLRDSLMNNFVVMALSRVWRLRSRSKAQASS